MVLNVELVVLFGTQLRGKVREFESIFSKMDGSRQVITRRIDFISSSHFYVFDF